MTKHFKREELARCFRENGARCKECPLKQSADKLPDGVEENLQALVENVLEPARQRYGGPILVNSGYRCLVHNKTVGGVSSSQHMRGEAVDIRPVKSEKLKDKSELERLAEIIIENGKWDQMIIYSTFLHVSYKRNDANRRQVLYKV